MSATNLSDVSQPVIKRRGNSHDGDESQLAMATRLQQAAKMMDVPMSDSQVSTAMAYAQLLLKWNQASNLTAIRSLKGVVDKHFLDCLGIVKHVHGACAIDLGSGNGFPGVAVALVRPQMQVVLVDAKAKKVQFLRHAIQTLGLTNVTAIHQRIQALTLESLFDTILARSLGSVAAVAELAFPLLAPDGRIIAMKGQLPITEIDALSIPCRVSVKKVTVPSLDVERHCVILQHA